MMKLTARFWKQSLIASLAAIATPTVLFAAPANVPLADGIYLFGQSPKPEEIGKEYLVFRVRQGKMTGAIFAPQSEFSCFTGTIDPRQVNLAIVDPYENEVYRHSIDLTPPAPVASGRPVVQRPSLEGYYSIETIGDNDRRMLQTCLEQLRD